MELSWLSKFAKSWRQVGVRQRAPHAVMLIGAPGVGKRAAADWIARQRLTPDAGPGLPTFPFTVLEHADMHWLAIPEDKKTIGIEQIRALIADLNLTSYEGRGKVAVIDPANEMTASAANSLLKTLEEPPGDALLILVADRVGKLPATIFSRCQRIEMPIPSEESALSWLEQKQPGAAWVEALRMSGGGPLAAVAALGDLETGRTMARDFEQVGRGAESAVDVAARWAKLDAKFVLNWLANQAKMAIVATNAGRDYVDGTAMTDSVLRRMDTRNLFCYLDIINRLRDQPGGSFNVQLTLEGLLIDWASGLADVGRNGSADGLELMLSR